jgi:asparagine synthase (glutamine-hydrolysing)
MSSRICGIFATKDLSLAREENLLAMLNAFQHQKTGQRDTFVDKQAGIAIGYLGESNRKEKQGFSNNSWLKSEDVVVTVDGHISDNHLEFSNIEWSEDHGSNTARAVTSFRESATHLPEGLDGQFALAFWNRQDRDLWLVKDPLGLKPLYYYYTNSGLVIFASEPKSILAHPAVSREIGEEGLIAYLTFGYIPAPNSIFKNIFKVFPGQAIKFNHLLQAEHKQYWRAPAFTQGEGTLNEFAEKTRAHILENVYELVKGQHRVGLFFSAGLDSTIVLAALRELKVPEVLTFTAGFTHPSNNKTLQSDMDWAPRFADKYSARHHTLTFKEGHDPLSDLSRIWRQFDEPILTPNTYTKTLLAKAACEAGIDVCLSGSSAVLGFRALLPKKTNKLQFPNGVKLSDIDAILEERTRFIAVEEQNQLLLDSHRNCKDIALGILEKHKTRPSYNHFFEMYKDNYATMHSPDKGITVQDRTASLYHLEIRFPFLSAKVINFARTIPMDLHWEKKSKIDKKVLITAFEDIVPAEIINRTKVGFPSYYWNNSELDPLIERLLSRKALEKSGILNPDTVEALLQEDRQDRGKSAGRLTWGLLSLQAWYEIHINRNDEILEF